ncbi:MULTISPECIES: STAS domain-containing protein [unclassified Blastococcus]|uniref:STAS domain-containing protein n=1 Tax=unclassified Blastococcus TaxID=2619396 RepID=UPI001EF0665A|nr:MULTISPECIES: STAS domain-containing protein [unclassified Blastococcus]
MHAADRAQRDPGTTGSSRHDSGEVVLRLTEEMLADGVADIRWALHDALITGARRVVVDVRDVEHLSSPAAASLLTAHRACRARGGSVVVRGANRRTMGLLRRTGLWRVLGLDGLDRPA